MKIDTKTMLEAFEETGGRGDALTLSRESLVALASIPVETFAPIFHRLFQWFINGDETPLTDPLANALLQSMKEHQKKNATKRRAYLVAQAEKSRKAAESHGKVRESHGNPTGTPKKPKPSQDKEEAEAKDISISDNISFASDAGRKLRAVDTALASSLSEEEAKKFLAINAPQVCSHSDMQNDEGSPNTFCRKFLAADNEDAVRMTVENILDEDCNAEQVINTIMNVISSTDDPDRAFRRVLAKVIIDVWHGDAENPAAFAIARVKKCRDALKSLQITKKDK